jgi:hypothetical protein
MTYDDDLRFSTKAEGNYMLECGFQEQEEWALHQGVKM